MELVDVLCLYAVGWLGAPEEAAVRRYDALCLRRVYEAVDISCIACVGVCDEREALSACWLQDSEEWVELLCLCYLLVCRLLVGSSSGCSVCLFLLYLELWLCLCVGLCCSGRVSHFLLCCVSHLFLSAVGETLVELCEVRYYFGSVECLPELEVCRALEELTHSLWLTYTRHLDHDTSLLSLKLLYVRLYDAELVDTVTYDIERVVDSRLYLCSQGCLDLLVRALC